MTFPEWCRVIAGKLRLQTLYISVVIDERPDLLLENARESGILNVRSLQVSQEFELKLTVTTSCFAFRRRISVEEIMRLEDTYTPLVEEMLMPDSLRYPKVPVTEEEVYLASRLERT